MKRNLLIAAMVFSFAAFTLEAFDNYDQAIQAGVKARSAKKFDEAIKNFEEAVKLTDDPVRQCKALIGMADLYNRKKDVKSALETLERIVQDDRMSAKQKVDALTRKGNFNKWRDNAEAEADFQKAMELKSSGTLRHELLNSYADLLLIMNRPQDAEKLLKEADAFTNSPDYLQLYTKLGLARIASEAKKYDEAQRLYLEVVRNRNGQWWQLNSGYTGLIQNVYLPQNKTKNALKILEHAEKNSVIPAQQKKWIIDYRIRVVYLHPAKQLMKEKKYDQAAELLKNVKELDKASKKVRQEIIRTREDIELER